MKASFKYAGMTTGVTELFLDDIERHKHVVYVTGTTGNFEDARQIALVAEAILKTGGLGVKVRQWAKLLRKPIGASCWHRSMELHFIPCLCLTRSWTKVAPFSLAVCKTWV